MVGSLDSAPCPPHRITALLTGDVGRLGVVGEFWGWGYYIKGFCLSFLQHQEVLITFPSIHHRSILSLLFVVPEEPLARANILTLCFLFPLHYFIKTSSKRTTLRLWSPSLFNQNLIKKNDVTTLEEAVLFLYNLTPEVTLLLYMCTINQLSKLENGFKTTS